MSHSRLWGRMEAPTMGAEGQALQATLRLLVGLLTPCLILLFLLNGLFLLHWRPAWLRLKGAVLRQAVPLPAAAAPQLFQVVPDSAVGSPGQRGPAGGQLLQPGGRAAAGRAASPLCCSCCCWGGPAAGPSCPRGPPTSPCSRFHTRGQACRGASQGPVAAAASSSSSDLEKHPRLVPPNSPATASGSHASQARGVPGGAFAICITSAQSKLRSCSGLACPSHSVPLEYSSSIQRDDDQRAPLDSANFTASQGPGLDSDFGASAGVSVWILSSDSEGSPNTPQQAGRFEWDYYDPSYKRQSRGGPPLPRICSKQFWL